MNDKELLFDRLNAGRAELLAAVEGLTDERAATIPADGGWSAIEILEHLATAETLMLRRLQHQATVVEVEMSREREAGLYDMLAARGRKFEAPEPARPTGRYATLSEALRGFETARERTLRYLETCDFDLRKRSAEHPALGTVSGYILVLLIAGHAARHARQIVESRATASELAQGA